MGNIITIEHIILFWYVVVYFFLPLSRYKAIPPAPITCKHNSKALRCSTLTNEDISKFHTALYSKNERQHQNTYLLKHMTINPVKRRRNDGKYSPSCFRTKYSILSARNKKTEIPVCLKTFLAITQINKNRLFYLSKKYYHEHGIIKDSRGGFREGKKFEDFQQRIDEFLNKLQYVESHYCRGDSKRKYLASELNIQQLYKLFVEYENNKPTSSSSEDRIRIKPSYFRYIFKTKHNIGFNVPQSDKCSTCLRYQEQLKSWNTGIVEQRPLFW